VFTLLIGWHRKLRPNTEGAKRAASGKKQMNNKNQEHIFGMDEAIIEDEDDGEIVTEIDGELFVLAEEDDDVGGDSLNQSLRMDGKKHYSLATATNSPVKSMRSKRSSFVVGNLRDSFAHSGDNNQQPDGSIGMSEDEVVEMLVTRLEAVQGSGKDTLAAFAKTVHSAGFIAEIAPGFSIDVSDTNALLVHLQSATPKVPFKAIGSICELLDSQTEADTLLEHVRSNNAELPVKTAIAVNEQIADAVGVLVSAYQSLENYLMTCATDKAIGFHSVRAKLQTRDEALDGALAMVKEWNISLEDEVTMLKKDDVKKMSVTAAPDKQTMHRVLGSLKVLATSPNTDSETKANATALIEAIMPTVTEAGTVMATRLVPRLNANGDLYDADFKQHNPDSATSQAAIARINGAVAKVPQSVSMPPFGKKTVANAENMPKITADPAMNHLSTTIPYAVHVEWVARKTSIALFLVANTIVATVAEAEVDAAPPKTLSRIVYKALLKYAGDFGKCHDVARITITATSLTGVAEVVEAFLSSSLVVVSRVLNRFGDDADVSGVRGRYRDVGLQCLLNVGGVHRQCEVLVTLSTMARIRDGFMGDAGGHRLYDAACTVLSAHYISQAPLATNLTSPFCCTVGSTVLSFLNRSLRLSPVLLGESRCCWG
jgi:hypothetical protein